MSNRFGTREAHGRRGVAAAIILAAATVSADSPQVQIDALNARVEALEARLAQVEAIAEARRKGAEEQPTPVAGGWRKAYNWGLLEKGMGPSAVESFLGEPEHTLRISKFDHWLYGDGRLRFYLGRLKSWELPGNLDPE